MGLLNQIQADIKDITTNSNEFARSISFEAPSGEKITINGLHTKHHLQIDTEGNAVNSKNSHISFSEDSMTGYPVRVKGKISLHGHKVTVKDSTGIDATYVIREFYPDETIGLIVCQLGDYGTD